MHVVVIFELTSSPKSLGRNLGMMRNMRMWMLDKEVNKWSIELMMEMPHIEWCFQFEN
jgi:hypothetical protein